jgi:hypothetical protein
MKLAYAVLRYMTDWIAYILVFSSDRLVLFLYKYGQ